MSSSIFVSVCPRRGHQAWIRVNFKRHQNLNPRKKIVNLLALAAFNRQTTEYIFGTLECSVNLRSSVVDKRRLDCITGKRSKGSKQRFTSRHFVVGRRSPKSIYSMTHGRLTALSHTPLINSTINRNDKQGKRAISCTKAECLEEMDDQGVIA
ncbi:hypothetical protein Ae201684_010823 [Aphanomyces euteiches]|uniref:Uncharacterized protein n=1 Tax=Aphanomyces euteiches TaxID=100861 RepID=A0A6G0WXF4_9STRA|nr:hypothetical protein Ae201684_010823 [Aphanomyces euteiches]